MASMTSSSVNPVRRLMRPDVTGRFTRVKSSARFPMTRSLLVPPLDLDAAADLAPGRAHRMDVHVCPAGANGGEHVIQVSRADPLGRHGLHIGGGERAANGPTRRRAGAGLRPVG